MLFSQRGRMFCLLIILAFLIISGCGDTAKKESVEKSDWFVQDESVKKVQKKITVNGIVLEIDRIKEKEEGVEIWWSATSEITKQAKPNPNASFAMGFDPAPVIEVTSHKGTGMLVYDRFNQLHLADLDEVKHTPRGKNTYTGYAFFNDIGIVDVNKIVVEDVILDLPAECEFKVNLPPNFQGALPINQTADIRDGKVTLRNLKISPEETKVNLKTEPNSGAQLQLVGLTGLTIQGQKYYDLKEAVGDEFQFGPLGSERDYTIKVWKASYRISGPWEWVIKE